jgi:hypothetical protein
LAVSRNGCPSFSTSRVEASISRPSNASLASRTSGCRARRSTVFTRAASSRGENGFVT